MSSSSLAYEISEFPRSLAKESRGKEDFEIHPYKLIGYQQSKLLSKIHPSLVDFPQICFLDVIVRDYNSPIIENEFALIRIEPEMRAKLTNLLQLWGMIMLKESTVDLKIGKYVFAHGPLSGKQLRKFLQHRYNSGSDSCEPVVFAVDTILFDLTFHEQEKEDKLHIDQNGLIDWVNLTLIEGAVKNLASAVSFRSANFPLVKFSRVVQSAMYMKEGKIKFDGFSVGYESMLKLYSEFPFLHDAVCFLHNHTSLLSDETNTWKGFKAFLTALARVLESEFMLLPTKQMIEKNQNLQFNYDFWHQVRQFMEDCCNFIIGNICEVDIPVFAYADEPKVEAELNNLTAEIGKTANELKVALSKAICFQEQQDSLK